MGCFPLGNRVCLIMKRGHLTVPFGSSKREMLLSLSFLITKPNKSDLSNLHYGPRYEPHYRTRGCLIRENNITDPIRNTIKDPIKDTLVPLRTNFNGNGSVRWRISVNLNLFYLPMQWGNILIIIHSRLKCLGECLFYEVNDPLLQVCYKP